MQNKLQSSIVEQETTLNNQTQISDKWIYTSFCILYTAASHKIKYNELINFILLHLKVFISECGNEILFNSWKGEERDFKI